MTANEQEDTPEYDVSSVPASQLLAELKTRFDAMLFVGAEAGVVPRFKVVLPEDAHEAISTIRAATKAFECVYEEKPDPEPSDN